MLTDAPIPYIISDDADDLTARDIQVRRFWNSLDQGGPDDCWRCMAANYGNVYFGGAVVNAGRVALHLATREPMTTPLRAARTCGTRDCCNPRHLEWRKVGAK